MHPTHPITCHTTHPIIPHHIISYLPSLYTSSHVIIIIHPKPHPIPSQAPRPTPYHTSRTVPCHTIPPIPYVHHAIPCHVMPCHAVPYHNATPSFHMPIHIHTHTYWHGRNWAINSVYWLLDRRIASAARRTGPEVKRTQGPNSI